MEAPTIFTSDNDSLRIGLLSAFSSAWLKPLRCFDLFCYNIENSAKEAIVVTDEGGLPRRSLYPFAIVSRHPDLEESYWERELPKLFKDIANVLHKINVKRGNMYDRLLRLVNGLFQTQWFQSVVFRDGRIFCTRRRGQLTVCFSLAEVKFSKLMTVHWREAILVHNS